MNKRPKKWKMAVLVWLAIYPTITLLFALFGTQFNSINPMPLQTMVVTLILVPLSTFLTIPILERILKKWLHQ